MFQVTRLDRSNLLRTNTQSPLPDVEIEFHLDEHSMLDWHQQSRIYSRWETRDSLSFREQRSLHDIRSTGNWTQKNISFDLVVDIFEDSSVQRRASRQNRSNTVEFIVCSRGDLIFFEGGEISGAAAKDGDPKSEGMSRSDTNPVANHGWE